MYDFIAIDFEIANRNFSSACSLGMVFVDQNKIIDEKYFLIEPPNLDVDEEYTKIHGLTIDNLKGAPKFNEVWDEIKHVFNEDTLIIAHNAQFDMSVLKSCLLEYSLDLPHFNYLCSIPISTIPCSGEGIGSSLKDRTEKLGVTIDNHHNALSDAKACTELVLKCIALQQRKSIYTYVINYTSISINQFKEINHQTTFFKKRKKFNSVKISDIVPSTTSFDESHPFWGNLFVFTGNLEFIDRKTAMQKVVDVGGVIKNGVTSKTNYLVLGKQDLSVVGEDGLSSKERKAYELIEKGSVIEILNELDFINKLKIYTVHN